jgi:hypothetical protein
MLRAVILMQDESEDLGDCLPLNGRLEVRHPDSAARTCARKQV